MTEHTVSGTSFGAPAHRPVALQGMDHGYVEKPARASKFDLWKWFPREILNRGGRVTRDDERAYSDLQAARDRSEW